MESARTPQQERPRVLLVDDDEHLLRATARSLKQFQVTAVASGAEAVDAVKAVVFDVVVSDIHMPEMTGLDLLRGIREADLDVPVVFFTGSPQLETAVRAIEFGALRYLSKPVELPLLIETIEGATRLSRLARIRRQVVEALEAPGKPIGDLAGLHVHFERALDALWMAYQPIVRLSDGAVVAYEALLRSREERLPHPGAILDAAERLGRLPDLGRAIRARIELPPPETAPGASVYVNLHPHDLLDPDLYDPEAPLSRIAGRVVLELTERATLDGIPDASARIARLRALGYRLALDDLGAGYAGLSSFATLNPEVVKLDMSLVRGVEKDPVRRRLIRAMIDLCDDLDAKVIAEGVETASERDALLALGCQLFQGYLFARPAAGFPALNLT